MDGPVTASIEDIDETHAKSAYAAASNDNIPQTTGLESNITVVNNLVDEVPEVTKEYEEEYSDVNKYVNSDDADKYDNDDDDRTSLLP